MEVATYDEIIMLDIDLRSRGLFPDPADNCRRLRRQRQQKNKRIMQKEQAKEQKEKALMFSNDFNVSA